MANDNEKIATEDMQYGLFHAPEPAAAKQKTPDAEAKETAEQKAVTENASAKPKRVAQQTAKNNDKKIYSALWKSNELDFPERDTGDYTSFPQTTIAKGTSFTGNIDTKGSIDIYGDLTGDISCKSKTALFANMAGDIATDELVLEKCVMKGNIRATSSVSLDKDSALTGDIIALGKANIAGKIEGNIALRGALYLAASATIEGNIIAYTVEIEKGAIINGNVAIKEF